jgi:hypothetical protein
MGFMLLPSFSAKDFDDAVWTQYLNERPSLVWLASVPLVSRFGTTPVCTKNLSSGVVVMKSA